MPPNNFDIGKWLGSKLAKKINVNLEEKLNLTQKQTLIFDLMDSKKSISRQQLRELIWYDTYVSDATIDVHIYNLRKKLIGKYSIKIKGHGTWELKKEMVH